MMPTWIRKVVWLQIAAVAAWYSVVSLIVGHVELLWTNRFYQDPACSNLMIPRATFDSELAITKIIATFFVGVGIALTYSYLSAYLPKGYWKRAFFVADVFMACYMIFFSVPAISLFHLPFLLVGYWFLSEFFVIVTTSLLCVKYVTTTK